MWSMSIIIIVSLLWFLFLDWMFCVSIMMNLRWRCSCRSTLSKSMASSSGRWSPSQQRNTTGFSHRLRSNRIGSRLPDVVVMENRSQSLHLQSDADETPPNANLHPHQHLQRQAECLAEEQFIDRLHQVIHEFMLRSGRHYSYRARIHWSIDYVQQIRCEMVLLVDRSAPRS